MCIKKEDPLKMPIQNGMVMKKKPKIVIASKPVSSGKKRLISPNHLGRLAVDSLITSPVKSEPKEIKEDTKVRAGTRAFISILIHAKTCRSCDDAKCKKMKMVMNHYIGCQKLQNKQECGLCRQLLKVVAEHALYLCPSRNGLKLPCPVPMCDVMRAKAMLKI